MRNYCLFFAIISVIACNPASSLMDEKTSDDGQSKKISGDANENVIRYRVGLRSPRSLNLIMHSLVGEAIGEREPDNTAGKLASNGMGRDVESAGRNSFCQKVSKCAEFTKTSWGQSVCKRNAGFEMVGKGKVGSELCSVSGLLPSGGGAGVSSGALLGLTGAGQVGIFKLGSAYCSQLMEDSAKGKKTRLQRLPSVAEQINAITLSKRPADMTEALHSAVAKALVENFHGSSGVRPNQQKTEQVLIDLMADLSKTKEKNNSETSNQEVLIGACAAALSSAQVTFY